MGPSLPVQRPVLEPGRGFLTWGEPEPHRIADVLAQVVRVPSYSQSLSFSPRDGEHSLGVARVESIDPTRLTCRTRDHLPYLLLVLHQGPELSPLVPTT